MAQPGCIPNRRQKAPGRMGRKGQPVPSAFQAVAWTVDRLLEADLADLICPVHVKVAHR
jgi:hypothetical protein